MRSCTRWRSDLTSFPGRKQDVAVYPGISNKSPSWRKAHETRQDICSGEQTVLSSRTDTLSSRSETATTGSDVVGAHRDHAGRGHQTGARRLPLSRPPLCGIATHLSQRRGRCPGITMVYLWIGYRAVGRTVAPKRAPDGR